MTTSLFFLLFLFSFLHQTSAIAEKKYIFRPGSRQAIEIDTDSAEYREYLRRQQMNTGARYRRMQRRQASSQAVPQRQTSSTNSKSRQKKKSYHYKQRVNVDGLNREVMVFVPASYSASQACPVLLVFHGLGMSASSMIGITGFNGMANKKGFVVIYCQSVGRKWNDGINNAKGVDDIKYVQAALKTVRERVNIDSRQIYACGLSNGGYFCQMLASALPDTIKGIAVVGSTVMSQGLSSPDSSKPVPAVFFFGSEDPLLNWGDDKVRGLGKNYGDKLGKNSIDPSFYKIARLGGWMSVGDTINYWVARNKCSNSPQTRMLPDLDRTDGMTVRLQAYGSRGNAVHVYTILGGEHSWPGALILPGTTKHRSCQDINSSEVIWDFFERYAR